MVIYIQPVLERRHGYQPIEIMSSSQDSIDDKSLRHKRMNYHGVSNLADPHSSKHNSSDVVPERRAPIQQKSYSGDGEATHARKKRKLASSDEENEGSDGSESSTSAARDKESEDDSSVSDIDAVNMSFLSQDSFDGSRRQSTRNRTAVKYTQSSSSEPESSDDESGSESSSTGSEEEDYSEKGPRSKKRPSAPQQKQTQKRSPAAKKNTQSATALQKSNDKTAVSKEKTMPTTALKTKPPISKGARNGKAKMALASDSDENNDSEMTPSGSDADSDESYVESTAKRPGSGKKRPLSAAVQDKSSPAASKSAKTTIDIKSSSSSSSESSDSTNSASDDVVVVSKTSPKVVARSSSSSPAAKPWHWRQAVSGSSPSTAPISPQAKSSVSKSAGRSPSKAKMIINLDSDDGEW
jgi:hypothetical protein